MPVTKHAVQALQVVQRCFGGCQHVAPVVAEGVLFELEVGAGGRHELPHTRGLDAGDCLRVKRAFDVRQQRQFGRHAAHFEFFNDVEQVLAGAFRHALHVVGPGGVPLLLVADLVGLQVGHGKTTANPLPHVGRWGRGGHTHGGGLGGRDGLQGTVGEEGGVGAGQRGLGCFACLRGRGTGVRGVGCGGGAPRQPEQACQAGSRNNFHLNSFFH